MEEAGAGGRAGIFEERALEDLKPPQGWTGPAGMTERGEGAVRTPAQYPSQSNPPELHSALTPSTAGSLVVGTVAGSHT